MKRICFPALLLLLLNGCFSCGTGSRREEVDPGLKIYRPAVPPLSDRHTSARLEGVSPGTWARYRIGRDGYDTTITFGAVGVEDRSLWLEVVEEGDPRKVSLRRISYDGDVLTARYQEIPASGPASEIADQPVSPGGETSKGAPAESSESKRAVKIGERSVDAVVLKNLYRDDALGREYEEEEAWSAAIPPLLEAREVGDSTAGLVYRKSAAGTVALVDWGTGYTPALK